MVSESFSPTSSSLGPGALEPQGQGPERQWDFEGFILKQDPL